MAQTPSSKSPHNSSSSGNSSTSNADGRGTSRSRNSHRERQQNPGSQNRQQNRNPQSRQQSHGRSSQNRNRPQPPKPFSPERLEHRRAAVPRISYPEQLPVSARREEIAAAIRDNQVVIVAGETGSGKTTQLPKICLELGRGISGFIGHTQPRRIAARSVAERICDELGVKLGGAIGYQVRFTEEVGPTRWSSS